MSDGGVAKATHPWPCGWRSWWRGRIQGWHREVKDQRLGELNIGESQKKKMIKNLETRHKRSSGGMDSCSWLHGDIVHLPPTMGSCSGRLEIIYYYSEYYNYY